MRQLVLALFVFVASAVAALAGDIKAGDLHIMHPKARVTLPGQPVSGGYLTIRNTGDAADRLVSVSSPIAGKSEIHEMKMEGDIMKMRPLADGLEIPAGGEVVLKPGGLHLMFMKLAGPVMVDDRFEVVLTFERAGTVAVMFTGVEIKPGHGHGDHDHENGHDHSDHSD